MHYPEFKVFVRCFTFNQASYILDTLNGFTIQKTNFPFICCIVDDASIDGEQHIIEKYLKDNFNLQDNTISYNKETDYAQITFAQHNINTNCFFAVLFLKENHYSKKKKKNPYLQTWRNLCSYEAICEGDDYWIDSLKLQKQIDFLEQNPDYGLIYSKSKVYNQLKSEFEKNTIGKEANSFDELIKLNCIPTLTTCYRKELIEKYRKEIKVNSSWKMGDYPLWLYISLHSKIKFLDETTTVYRKQEQTASNFKSMKERLAFLESSSNICSFYLTYANRWDLRNIYKEKYCSIIMSYYITYNLPIKFSSISKYWLWKPSYVLKYLLSQFSVTRRLLR